MAQAGLDSPDHFYLSVLAFFFSFFPPLTLKTETLRHVWLKGLSRWGNVRVIFLT